MKGWKLNLLLLILAAFTAGNTLLLMPAYLAQVRHLARKMNPPKWERMTFYGINEFSGTNGSGERIVKHGWKRKTEYGLEEWAFTENEPPR